MGLLYGRRRGSSRVWLDFARIVSYNILAWIPRVSAVSAALARRHPCQNRIPGCSAVGSAPALGAGCREFESPHSDQNTTKIIDFSGVFHKKAQKLYGKVKKLAARQSTMKGDERMAYSELIKNFERIRDYMREFYVYGFKSRDEFTKKSARSYDDERRRVESWLGDFITIRSTRHGKRKALPMGISRFIF